MRSLRSSLVRQIGGRPVLRELFDAVQAGWRTSGDYYRSHGLRDGHGLTSLRRDHVEASLARACGRYPQLFPAFDCGRRRTRSFALVEMEDLILSAALVARRDAILRETGYRRDAGRQISLWRSATTRKQCLIAVLLIVNGRPRPFVQRERPREIVIRFLDGPGYRPEEISLDAMFAQAALPRHRPLDAAIAEPARRDTTPLKPLERVERRGSVRLKPGLGEHSNLPTLST
jgi:hypothetical protein